MTLDQFVNRWTGEKADYDGQYGGECVDLYNFYMRDVFGLNPYQYGAVNGAQELAGNLPKYPELQWVGGATNIPKGAIVVFSGRNGFGGGYGHVGMSMGGLSIFDQIGGTDAQEKPPAIRSYPATNVLGYAIKKGESMIQDTDNEFARWEQLHTQLLGYSGGRQNFRTLAVGKTWLSQIEILSDHKDAQTQYNYSQLGRKAEAEGWTKPDNSQYIKVSELYIKK